MNNPQLLTVSQLTRQYDEGAGVTQVLKGINLEVHACESVAILGASGSGKSTLLHMIGGLERSTQGQIVLNGHAYSQLTDEKITELREQNIGFIYQFHHLLAELTALENVMMPLLIRAQPKAKALATASAILGDMGLGHRLDHKPSALSGGERQRVAIARAVVKKPALILADEPTGNLDKQSAEQVMELMLKLTREQGSSLILVTHDEHFARKTTRILRIEDGVLTPC